MQDTTSLAASDPRILIPFYQIYCQPPAKNKNKFLQKLTALID
jgi:hypothetical protein